MAHFDAALSDVHGSSLPAAIEQVRRVARDKRSFVARWRDEAATLEQRASALTQPWQARFRHAALQAARDLRRRAAECDRHTREDHVEERIAGYIVECAVSEERQRAARAAPASLRLPPPRATGKAAGGKKGDKQSRSAPRGAEDRGDGDGLDGHGQMESITQSMLEEFAMAAPLGTIENNRRCSHCHANRRRYMNLSALYCDNCGTMERVADEPSRDQRRRNERRAVRDEIVGHMIQDVKAVQFLEARRVPILAIEDIVFELLRRNIVCEEIYDAWRDAFPHLGDGDVRLLTPQILDGVMRDIQPRRKEGAATVARVMAMGRSGQSSSHSNPRSGKRRRVELDDDDDDDSAGSDATVDSVAQDPVRRAIDVVLERRRDSCGISGGGATSFREYYKYITQIFFRSVGTGTHSVPRLSLMCERKFIMLFVVLKAMFMYCKDDRVNYVGYPMTQRQESLRLANTTTLGTAERESFAATLPYIRCFGDMDPSHMKILKRMEAMAGMDVSAKGIVIARDARNPPPIELQARLSTVPTLWSHVESELGL